MVDTQDANYYMYKDRMNLPDVLYHRYNLDTLSRLVPNALHMPLATGQMMYSPMFHDLVCLLGLFFIY